MPNVLMLVYIAIVVDLCVGVLCVCVENVVVVRIWCLENVVVGGLCGCGKLIVGVGRCLECGIIGGWGNIGGKGRCCS